jgi:hypothetical protein
MTVKKTIQFAALVGALTICGAAFAQQTYETNPGRPIAQSQTGPCGGYDGTATTTGAGAGGFGFQVGQGENQAGGNAGTANYNPMICGNPNDNALVRGPN